MTPLAVFLREFVTCGAFVAALALYLLTALRLDRGQTGLRRW